MYLFYLCIIGHNMLYSKKELPRHSENFRDRQFFFVLQNHMSWANFLTVTAACTLIVIDVRTEIGNCDRLGRTILFTFFTADTAKLAGSCNCLTFCVGAAGYTLSLIHILKLPFFSVSDSSGFLFHSGRAFSVLLQVFSLLFCKT